MHRKYLVVFLIVLSFTVWGRTKTHPLLKTIQVNEAGISSLGFSRDANKFVCSSCCGLVFVVNCTAGKIEKVIKLNDKVLAVSSCCNKEYFAVLCKSILSVYSWKDYSLLYTYKQPTKDVFFSNIDISEEGKYIALSAVGKKGYFNSIIVIDNDKRKPAWALRGNKSVLCVSFLESNLLLAGEKKGYVKLWNIKFRRRFKTYFAQKTSYVKIIRSGNKNYFLGLNSEGRINIWDRYTKELVKKTPVAGYSALSFSPKSDYVIIARKHEIDIFSVYERRLVKIIYSHQEEITDIKFHKKRMVFATASKDGTVKLWKWGL